MSADTDRSTSEDLPPQVHMPLLDYVTATSLDADYAHVAERTAAEARRAEAEQGSQAGDPTSRPAVRPGVAALVVMGVFGVLVTTAAVQTARNAEDTSNGRESLVTQIKARSTQLDARRARIANLRAENESLQNLYLETTSQGRALSSRLERLRVMSGATPVTGPGVQVVVDDAPGAVSDQQRVLDEDLQKLVNALWASGAEAISVNGQRLTGSGAFRNVGLGILANNQPINPPYVFTVIGDPDTLPANLLSTAAGAQWYTLKDSLGFRFGVTGGGTMTVPAAATPTLRSARVAPTTDLDTRTQGDSGS